MQTTFLVHLIPVECQSLTAPVTEEDANFYRGSGELFMLKTACVVLEEQRVSRSNERSLLRCDIKPRSTFQK